MDRPRKINTMIAKFRRIAITIIGYFLCVPLRCAMMIRQHDPIPVPENPSTIVIAVYGGLGDAIMMLPALRLLRERAGKQRLAVYVEEKTAFDIIENTGFADKLFLMDIEEYDTSWKRWKFIWNNIRPLRPEIAVRIYMHSRFQDTIETYLTGAKIRIGYTDNKWLSSDTHFLKTNALRHRVLDHVDMVSHIGAGGTVCWPTFRVAKEDTLWADAVLNSAFGKKVVVGIHPGCKAQDQVRRWPEENFATLTDRLIENHGAEVVLFSGPHDLQSTNRIIETLHSRPLLVTSQPLHRVAALIRKCTLFISNDSGLMHLASLLGVPVIGIFGCTSFTKHGPWGEAHCGVISKYPCSPCWLDVRHECEHGGACMKSITIEEVYGKVSNVMERLAPKTHC